MLLLVFCSSIATDASLILMARNCYYMSGFKNVKKRNCSGTKAMICIYFGKSSFNRYFFFILSPRV